MTSKADDRGADPVPPIFDDAVAQKPDPFDLFGQWLTAAGETEVNDPNAMALATVDAQGLPDCRIMLLNGWDRDGFVFYTNTRSAKGQELAARPVAALLFHWKSVRRQIRIRGAVEQVSDAQADAYFATRPRGSRIGAHASRQSSPLDSRRQLIDRVEELTAGFGDGDVPRPAHWTGFRVVPVQMEFWQNGEYRLHDRVRYTRTDRRAPWASQRLNP